MGDILSQLSHLLVQSLPTVVFVFLLTVVLDWLFFKPLTGVLKQREEATVGALARAREQAAAAEAKAREYEAALQAAEPLEVSVPLSKSFPQAIGMTLGRNPPRKP